MSETPRTDALAERQHGELDRPMLAADHVFQLWDHSRALEREVAALRAKLEEEKEDKRCLVLANEAITAQANQAITRADQAEAALAECREDVERYRWAKANDLFDGLVSAYEDKFDLEETFAPDPQYYERCDAAIDAARGKK